MDRDVYAFIYGWIETVVFIAPNHASIEIVCSLMRIFFWFQVQQLSCVAHAREWGCSLPKDRIFGPPCPLGSFASRKAPLFRRAGFCSNWFIVTTIVLCTKAELREIKFIRSIHANGSERKKNWSCNSVMVILWEIIITDCVLASLVHIAMQVRMTIVELQTNNWHTESLDRLSNNQGYRSHVSNLVMIYFMRNSSFDFWIWVDRSRSQAFQIVYNK